MGNTILDGLVVVLVNGGDDLSYNAFDLDGFSTDGDGFFLLGNSGVTPTPEIIFSDNGLQNGPDAVTLYIGDDTDYPNNTDVTPFAQTQDVTVSVFDLLGRRVTDLHQGALPAGTAHAFTLNGRDLASGFYVVRVSGETFSDSRRVTLLK